MTYDVDQPLTLLGSFASSDPAQRPIKPAGPPLHPAYLTRTLALIIPVLGVPPPGPRTILEAEGEAAAAG